MVDSYLIKDEALSFFENLRVKNAPYGCYRYASCQTQPILYASTYAALARHLLGDLNTITPNQKKEWSAHIQSFQGDNGFFQDPLIAHEGSWYVPPHMEWCGWWHLTCHVVMALTALNVVAEKEMAMLKPFYRENYLKQWLEKRELAQIAFVGNEILNLGMLLQYARDFHQIKPAAIAMEIILEWLDQTQDSSTGLWGDTFATPEDMNSAYQGAYHFYLLYEYDRREIRYPERIIDSMLSMQTEQGGFGIRENTSGCEDIDAIDPLARLYFHTDYRREETKAALERAFDWVLRNRTPDQGFAFIKDSEVFYGSKLMFSGKKEGSAFATWWRMLSLAIMSKVATRHPLVKLPWQFLSCPGYQFWRKKNDTKKP